MKKTSFTYSIRTFPWPQLLKKFAMDLLYGFHLLCGKTYTNAEYDNYVQRVDQMEERWQECFNSHAPVCAHIMDKHWRVWLRLVKSHAVRTEGGELLNEVHLDAFLDATSKYSPEVGQISMEGKSDKYTSANVCK